MDLVNNIKDVTLNGSTNDMSGATGSYIRIASSVGSRSRRRSDFPPLEGKGLGDAVWLIYFILGTGFLLPWNAFITAVDYFGYLYPDTQVDRVFSVSYFVPCLLVLCLLISYGKHMGARAKINWGMGMFIVSLLVVPVMEGLVIQRQQASSATYYVTVGGVVLAGVGDALVQGTLIGFAGQLPEKYTQAIVSGTGFSGVLVSFLRVVTKFVFPGTSGGLRSSANLYFAVSIVFLTFCVLAYNVVHGITVGMVYMDESGKDVAVEGLVDEAGLGVDEEKGEADGEGEKTLDGDGWEGSPVLSDVESPSAVVGLEGGDRRLGWWQVFLQIKWLAVAIALIYVITLAIFPGFLTEDVTSDVLRDWYPVLLIGVYNVFDLVGKSMPVKYVPSNQVYGFGRSALRLLFFPLYSACVHGPKAFRSETPVFVLTALLGLSNGFLTSCFFMVAPKSLKSGPLDAETAGVVMVLALEVGLTLGSLLSWVWVV